MSLPAMLQSWRPLTATPARASRIQNQPGADRQTDGVADAHAQKRDRQRAPAQGWLHQTHRQRRCRRREHGARAHQHAPNQQPRKTGRQCAGQAAGAEQQQRELHRAFAGPLRCEDDQQRRQHGSGQRIRRHGLTSDGHADAERCADGLQNSAEHKRAAADDQVAHGKEVEDRWHGSVGWHLLIIKKACSPMFTCASSYKNSSVCTAGLVSAIHKRNRPAGKYART